VVYPGDTVEFTITIEKGYNNSEEAWCAPSISSIPEGWTAGFYNNGDQADIGMRMQVAKPNNLISIC
jgi:uncharacterized membrane protein